MISEDFTRLTYFQVIRIQVTSSCNAAKLIENAAKQA